MDLGLESSGARNSFVVLLHTSLKSENMSAIVKLSDDWYGALHCGTDNKNDGKKRSYLMLSIFIPDIDIMENIIASASKATSNANNLNQVARPIPPTKSYTKGCIVWYRAYNLVVYFILL